MELDDIRAQLNSDKVGERANGAKLLADKADSDSDSLAFNSDGKINTEPFDLAIQAATDDDPDTKYYGAKALSYLVSSSSINKSLVTIEVDEDDQTYVDRIESIATANLSKSNPGRVRGRSALIVSWLTSDDVDSGANDELVKRLTDLLATGEKEIRQSRAARALSNLSEYDREQREYVRTHMATAAESLSELASSEKALRQSNALRAIGFMGLSNPEAALPATELHTVVEKENKDARPRNRNRAVRSLGHIGRTHSSVIVPVHSTVEELLHYTEADAEASDYLSKDQEDLDDHAGYIRSNAAMALAQLARDQPELISESTVERCVEMIRSRDSAFHRAMRLLGRLDTSHEDAIQQNTTKKIVEIYLTEECRSKSIIKQHTKARGYAVWLLTRLADSEKELEPFETRYLDFLSEVPISERTVFETLRTEALATLCLVDPHEISEHESSIDWLLERVGEASDSAERADAIEALVAMIEANTTTKKRIVERLIDRLGDESDPHLRMQIAQGLGMVADASVQRTLADAAVEESSPTITTAITNSLNSSAPAERVDVGADHPIAPNAMPVTPVTEYTSWIQANIQKSDITMHDEIERGGNGKVYKATLEPPAAAPNSKSRTIAIKKPLRDYSVQRETAEKLLSEAKKWAEAHGHPNIVTVFGWGTRPHTWIAMEYVNGGELGEYSETNQLPISQAVWMGICIADALRHAHEFSTYHHDITPSNILLDTRYEWPIPKLTDWGTARRRNEESQDCITPGYAAPEQLTEESVSPSDAPIQTDLYQLATVVYELLAGRKPFEPNEEYEKLSTTPDPPSTYREGVPAAIDEVLIDTLSPQPGQRPETAAQFRNRLNNQL